MDTVVRGQGFPTESDDGLTRRHVLRLIALGSVAVPSFAGYDEETERGRIFNYDVTGGCYEEQRFASIGSGSVFARGALKKLYRDGMSSEDVVLACMQALYDAADDDSATGGPDLTRKIFPVIMVVTEDGYRRLSEPEVSTLVHQVVDARGSQRRGHIAQAREIHHRVGPKLRQVSPV